MAKKVQDATQSAAGEPAAEPAGSDANAADIGDGSAAGTAPAAPATVVPALDPNGQPATGQAPAEAAPSPEVGAGSAASKEALFVNLDNETYCAAMATLEALHAVAECEDAQNIMTAVLHPDAAKVASALIRKIGERATTDVVAQELYLNGHRESGTLEHVERLVIDLFVGNLRRIDDFKASMKRLYDEQEAEKNRPAPRKVPIEDTMLEPSDGPMDSTY